MGLVIGRPAQVLARAAWAILCAASLVALASVANFVTTAPRTISLLFEPFSLLLLPGLVASLIVAGPHDYSLTTVVLASIIFYAFAFYIVFLWLSRRRALR